MCKILKFAWVYRKIHKFSENRWKKDTHFLVESYVLTKSKLLALCRNCRNHPYAYRLTTSISTHHYAEAFLPRCLPHPSSDACSSSASFSFWFELASTSDTDLGEGQDEAGNLLAGRGSTDEAPFLQLKPIKKYYERWLLTEEEQILV